MFIQEIKAVFSYAGQLMKVLGLDNKEYTFNYSKFYIRNERDGKSSLHLEARQLLKEMLVGYSIYEEVTLPGCKTLYADFFIPQIRLVVEVHGEQHYKYIPFFHKQKADFFLGKKRDKNKIQFCEINDFSIAILPYNEKDKWNLIILESMKSKS
jgi:very-short-patch-repair endonuclease